MIRKSIVAGQFYESDFGKLDNQIKSCFEHEKGPATTPLKRDNNRIVKGIISPHAGYAFSGPCAAWSYKEIGESKFPDIFIIIGPSHSGYDSCFSRKDFETPFGIVKNDENFLSLLIKNTMIPINEEAHEKEHSIEVQLPFLQFSNKDMMNVIKIVPLLIGPGTDIKKIGEGIKKAIEESKKQVCMICSSDFTHYGINYGYMPFFKERKEKMYGLDKGAIQKIEDKDTEGFVEYVKEKEATICGAKAIALLMESIDCKKPELLQYYTSGDIVEDYNNAVGYAAIVFK